jgi:hypothetical protein
LKTKTMYTPAPLLAVNGVKYNGKRQKCPL